MKTACPWALGLASSLGLFVLAVFAGGCAAPSNASSAPKPGRGIAEYRQVARDAHRSVTDVVEALDALAQGTSTPSAPPPALAGFDRALMQLELTSIQARARAEAIIGRGQSYFEEWNERLLAVTNQAAARVEQENYTRLFEHFGRVRERSGDVREQFRPLMSRLREFRASIDKSTSWLASGPGRKELDEATESGRRVLQALASVSAALDQAEIELRKTVASHP